MADVLDTTAAASGAPLEELEMAAWAGFLRTHATLVRELDEELTRMHGLPLSSYDVLIQLSNAPDKRMRLSQLAEAVLLSRSGLSRLVARLVDQGLLERAECSDRSEEHTSELQSRQYLVCRLLLEKKS